MPREPLVDPHLPETFTVEYIGHPIVFERLDDGWGYRCPNACCKAYHWIETRSGARHRITSGPGQPVTIVASLACPNEGTHRCNWHVFIENGVVRDA